MKVISSQHYIDYEIVDKKIAEMQGTEKVVLPIVDAEMKDEDGNDLYVLIDGHHRKEAAEELGIEIEYEEVENPYNVTGELLLETCYMDGDWYYVDNGATVW